MSWGIGHQCMTMGIAEAIAIKTMITANVFAISFRLGPALGWPLTGIAAVLTAAIPGIQMDCDS